MKTCPKRQDLIFHHNVITKIHASQFPKALLESGDNPFFCPAQYCCGTVLPQNKADTRSVSQAEIYLSSINDEKYKLIMSLTALYI